MRQASSYTSQCGTAETMSHAVAAMKQVRKLLLPGIIAALSSCGGSKAVTAPPDPLHDVIGSYALIHYDDDHQNTGMPPVFTQGDLNRLTTLGGTLLLREDNTFTLRTILGVIYSAGYINGVPGTALPGFARGLDNGSYTVSGSSITLRSIGGGVGTGVAAAASDLYPPFGPVKSLTITWPATNHSPAYVYTFQKD